MNRYEPATPRALAGVAALFMTVATLSLSVLAPAAVDSESREVSVLTLSSEPESHAFANAGPLTTSIDVVAFRTTRLVPEIHKRTPRRTAVSS
jgi:hypothetical protein